MEAKKAITKDKKELDTEIARLKKAMKKASDDLNFEEAARIRDEIKRLQMIELEVMTVDEETVKE